MICANCGTNNRDGVKFCSTCGSALPEPPAYQSVYQDQAQQHNQSMPPYPGAMQPVPGAYGGRVTGERREIPITIILALVTCGFYGIYWYYKMFSEIAADLGRTDINPVMDIVLVPVTCGIYGFYLLYKYPKLMTEMQAKRGLPINDISVMSVVLGLFGLAIVSFAMMQSELNKLWEADGVRR